MNTQRILEKTLLEDVDIAYNISTNDPRDSNQMHDINDSSWRHICESMAIYAGIGALDFYKKIKGRR